jgi:hypothetical protein
MKIPASALEFPACLRGWAELHEACDGGPDCEIVAFGDQEVLLKGFSDSRTEEGEVPSLVLRMRCRGCLADDVLLLGPYDGAVLIFILGLADDVLDATGGVD